MSSPRPLMHPRAVIRRAVCALLAGSGFPGPVWPSREEPWLADELPVMGVYTTEERRLESDQSPEPDDRELTLVVELLDREALSPDAAPLDDRLDELSLYPETTLFFEAVRDSVAHGAREAGYGEADASAMVQDFAYSMTAVGEAEDGRRVVACAVLTFALTYRMPAPVVDADRLKTIVSGWDLADFPPPHGGPDGRLEAESINRFVWSDETSKGADHADHEGEAEARP